MIALIVNADDFGTSTERDRGILEAFAQGIVTSASLLANGASFDAAAAQARVCSLPVGVHLNLAEGRPLGGPIAGLTDATGRFPGKAGLRQYLAGASIADRAIRRECRLQIETALDAGLCPDHLDTHQHAHLFPRLLEIICDLAGEYGIRAIRNPRPAEPPATDPVGPLGEELALYRRLAPGAESLLTARGLTRPDGLWGTPLLNRLDTATLCDLLDRIPAGTWELMVHPGYPDSLVPFSGPERRAELEALCAAETRDRIAARPIRLLTFGDLPCAS